MSDYIERATAIEAFTEAEREADCPGADFPVIKRILANLPAADVVEVRHGYWIDHHSGGSFCSACKRWVPYSHHPKYCETCGARMDGKKNDHAVN